MKDFNTYWLPKLHKLPAGSPFIIAASKCSVKTLSRVLTSIIGFFLKTKARNDKYTFCFGVSTFQISN